MGEGFPLVYSRCMARQPYVARCFTFRGKKGSEEKEGDSLGYQITQESNF
jgi:hypothetical protein